MNIIEVEAMVIEIKASSGGFTAKKKEKDHCNLSGDPCVGWVGSFSSCQNVSSVSERTGLDESRR